MKIIECNIEKWRQDIDCLIIVCPHYLKYERIVNKYKNTNTIVINLDMLAKGVDKSGLQLHHTLSYKESYGDLLMGGYNKKKLYYEVMKILAQRQIKDVILVGHKVYFDEDIEHYPRVIVKCYDFIEYAAFCKYYYDKGILFSMCTYRKNNEAWRYYIEYGFSYPM